MGTSFARVIRSLFVASEAKILRAVHVKMSTLGVRLFRNTIGRFVNADGRWINYGLVNPGGSDLIGWRQVKITHDMVGLTIAQFTAVEVKSASGRLSQHQEAFIEAVNKAGGFAICVRSVDESVRGISAKFGQQN